MFKKGDVVVSLLSGATVLVLEDQTFGSFYGEVLEIKGTHKWMAKGEKSRGFIAKSFKLKQENAKAIAEIEEQMADLQEQINTLQEKLATLREEK